jgi:hypothetical protein
VAVSCEDFHEPSDFLKGGELFWPAGRL